ncbi:hypothetical protein KTD31_00380 [Burkholderia multivorans]|uniref:hypothetical protein n=1 Tax=Burkholderia multivorans TaxID=87883 RepID=UPI001C24AC73|nr:hypothetical protein [Burkholderia multivorans]MBU9199855.1 hypothetical protein [Burkholderia multivorans]MDN8079026.1 hypothetical protein [Burkholderia multivorans]
MKKREFDSTLRSVSVKGKLSPAKAAALPSDTRAAMMKFVVRNREPLATCLYPDDIAQHGSWLNAMGYLYQTVSPATGLTFRHTGAHIIR